MTPEQRAQVDRVEEALGLLGRSLDLDEARKQYAALEARAADGELWNDPDAAKKVMQDKRKLELSLGRYDDVRRRLDDALVLLELAEAENDAASVQEAEGELAALVGEADKLETQCLLSGEADANNAYLEIHAGAGGTESCDWAGMLLRMYSRWAERQGFKVDTVDYAAGEQAGIKSATLHIQGPYAFGMAKTEGGVHRLVRISPFDSNARRHTSFSSVYVYPEVDDDIDIDINPADLRVDTYRSQGAGGQHVNTTESAVRITHIPTNIVVSSQQDKSQHRNRDICMRMLKARLYEHEVQKREEAAAATNAEKSAIGWGHQIRSYVLQPYQMVKDLRTDVETSNTGGVLDGELDAFIKAALADKVGNKRA
ncbi:MAG: peptide chain release factor 2 [Pseudomonadaceae bacterium]|nr:peptide chain release factor 2 [Pseudomonadaceae bacterium]